MHYEPPIRNEIVTFMPRHDYCITSPAFHNEIVTFMPRHDYCITSPAFRNEIVTFMPRHDNCITSSAFRNEIVTPVALGTVTLRVSAYSYAFPPIVTRFHLYRSSDNRKEVHTIDTIYWFQLPLPELQL